MSEENDLLSAITSILASDSEALQKKPVSDNATPTEPPIDLEMIMKLGNLLSDFSTTDARTKLLHDLKPFLSDRRRDKIDSAVKILKLLKIAEKAKNENIF